MAARRPIITANWKMQKTALEAQAFVEVLLPELRDLAGCDVVIAAPFTALDRLASSLGGSPVALAAQNVSTQPDGAFTGEISVRMLVEHGCRYAIVGHSERRALYGETSAEVALKAQALQAAGIVPIVCVGETLQEREADRTLEVIGAAVEESLDGVEAGDGGKLVVAYEPVWAIGTGKTATPEIAQQVHALIRERLNKQFAAVADSIRIQYGGSVNPENVAELMAQGDIDGALVGGASLEPGTFLKLVKIAAQETQ